MGRRVLLVLAPGDLPSSGHPLPLAVGPAFSASLEVRIPLIVASR